MREKRQLDKPKKKKKKNIETQYLGIFHLQFFK